MDKDPTRTGGLVSIVSEFHIYLEWVNAHLQKCLNRFLNVKTLVGTFNQEKALVGAFPVIVQLHRLFGYSTTFYTVQLGGSGGG